MQIPFKIFLLKNHSSAETNVNIRLHEVSLPPFLNPISGLLIKPGIEIHPML